MNIKRYKPLLLLAVFIIILPILTSLFKINFLLTQLTMSAYYVLVALGLCLLMGYAGQISLGQAGFFAIGGYTSALLTTINFIKMWDVPFIKLLTGIGVFISGKNLYGEKILYLSPWIGFIAAIIFTAVIAFLIGIPVLKLKGHYLAMATLGFGVIIEKIVRGTKIFGGADGISNVPAFTLLPGIKVSGERSDRILNFLIAWAVIVIGLIILTNLINSRVGRALRSIHGSEDAAESMGINTAGYKLNVFVIGAIFSAAAGIFMTHFNGSIGPGEANVMKSIRYVSIVAVGGMANLWGTLVMGLILNFLSLRGVFGTYDDAVFGAILILVMIFAPDGFIRTYQKKLSPEKNIEIKSKKNAVS